MLPCTPLSFFAVVCFSWCSNFKGSYQTKNLQVLVPHFSHSYIFQITPVLIIAILSVYTKSQSLKFNLSLQYTLNIIYTPISYILHPNIMKCAQMLTQKAVVFYLLTRILKRSKIENNDDRFVWIIRYSSIYLLFVINKSRAVVFLRYGPCVRI